MGKIDTFVSVVAVCQDHAAVLPAFLAEVSAVLTRRYSNFEVVLLDNASADDTPAVVREALRAARCVRYLRLSRKLDDETALTAGLDAAIGDFVVTLHPDFDPPAEIPALVERCRAGADVVIGVEQSPPRHGPAYRLGRRLFLQLARSLMKFEPVTGLTSLRCLSRSAVNALTRVRSRRRHFAMVLAEVGFRPALHRYDRISRSGGRPRPDLTRATRIGLSVLVHYSVTPLRLVSVLGLVGSTLSLLYSAYVVAVYLLKRDVMPGWTTLSLQVSGMFFLVFVMLTLMGECLGRVLEELVDRPLYHLRDEQSSAVMLSEVARRNVMNESECA
jgi:glycosyltransferase involved in cell wall biosynthesis